MISKWWVEFSYRRSVIRRMIISLNLLRKTYFAGLLVCNGKYMFQNLFVCFSQAFPSPLHGIMRYFQRFLKLKYIQTFSASPGERRNKFRWVISSKNIGAYAGYRPGIEHGIDTCFGVVAHH